MQSGIDSTRSELFHAMACRACRPSDETTLRRLAQDLRQPAGAGGLALGEISKLDLFQVAPHGGASLLQSRENLRLADLREEIVCGRHEPVIHVEPERRSQSRRRSQ